MSVVGEPVPGRVVGDRVMFRALRVYLSIEGDRPFTQFTGRLTKTLALLACEGLTSIHGLRGIISPLHVSPLFTVGRGEWELGSVATPFYSLTEEREYVLEPLEFDGEYIVHFGGHGGIVECIERGLERLRPKVVLRFADSLVGVRVEKAGDVTGEIEGKAGGLLEGGRVTVYFKGPARFFNIFTPTRLPKLYPSAPEVFMAPYMALTGYNTISYNVVVEASRLLGLMVETYYSLRTVRPLLVPFKNAREPGVVGKVTYIVDTRDPGRLEMLGRVLAAGEIVGVGESRANGFGTVAWRAK